MTTPSNEQDTHRPTDAFRGYLEWEVSRTVRRGRRARRLRTAAVVLVSAGFGMSATIASAQIRQGGVRDSLLEAARAEAAIVAVRVGLAQSQLADAQRKVASGVSSSETLPAAELQLLQMTVEAQRVSLNMAEIERTAAPPRDDLNAPLIGGRDFVKERIEIQLAVAQRQLQIDEQALGEANQRVQLGAAGALSATDAGLALERAKRDLSVLATRLDLRREFIEKGTPVADLTKRMVRAQTRLDLSVAQQAMKVAEARLSLVEKQHDLGAATDIELAQARLGVLESQVQTQLLVARLRDLGSG